MSRVQLCTSWVHATQGLGQSNGPWTFEFQATVTLEKKRKKEETEGNDVSLVVFYFARKDINKITTTNCYHRDVIKERTY